MDQVFFAKSDHTYPLGDPFGKPIPGGGPSGPAALNLLPKHKVARTVRVRIRNGTDEGMEPMATESLRPLAPPRAIRPDGAQRRIGIEIEFAALRARDAAELVSARFGGTLRQEDPHRYSIAGTEDGPFTVELDAQYVHPNERLEGLEVDRPWLSEVADLVRDLDSEASRLLGDLAGDLIPCEIVCPPLPWARLGEIEALYRDLGTAGAVGTDRGLLYAFGLHMNVESAGDGVEDLLPVMKAYLLLSPWLRDDIRVDGTRRVFPFIDPFPGGYVRRVCDPDYRPDMNRFVSDYLAFNDTRNRELDMLPILAHLRPARVQAGIDDPRVKPRPAFHWRLPNALFGAATAGPIADWHRWITVERLAEDSDALDAACARLQTLEPLSLSETPRRLAESLAAEFRP